MRYRFCVGLILLMLIGCSKTSTTAPSDFTISAPAAATDTFSTISPPAPGTPIIYTLRFPVRDADGKPRQGVKVNFLLMNATLCSDSSCSSTVSTPYEVNTNDFGVATAYVLIQSPACSDTADKTYTVTLTALLETTDAKWTDAVTVKKCGT